MALIRGVEFSDAVAPAIQQLTDRFIQLIGEDHCYTRGNHIKFAMSPPEEPEIADGVIMQIGPRHNGAFLERARPPKGGPKWVPIEPEDMESAYQAGVGYYEEMQEHWKEKKGKKRNPVWTHDELVLALEFYFRLPPWTISGRHPEIIKLSEELRRLAAYLDVPDVGRYRNESGTYMKLMNFGSIDPSRGGKGLKGGGKNDREVWDKYSSNRRELVLAAAAIRKAMVLIEENESEVLEPDIEEAAEGAILTKLHRFRERDPALAQKKKRQALKRDGKLVCEVCRFDFAIRYGAHGSEYIECHHTTPLAALPEGKKTTIEDLALVCANCHRMLHRKKQWLTIAQLCELLVSERTISNRSDA